MDFTKTYILQAISLASNNLRLSADRIETVTLLKDYLQNSENLKDEIAMMKTKTELSKLGIKLGEAYKYVESLNVDFLKLTDTFKEHSHNLIVELSNVLDQVNVDKLRDILFPKEEDELSIYLGNKSTTKDIINEVVNKEVIFDEEISNELQERDSLKESIILEDVAEPNRFDFADFEETILKPVPKIEKLLKELENNQVSDEETIKIITIMKKNAKLSNQIGFNILSEMHRIFYTSLEKINNNEISLDKKLVESMRACLIVIVAIVRSKDVDITNYINKAEKLGKYLKLT